MQDLDQLIIWILVAYGITNIVVVSKIFKHIRDWIGSKSQFFGGMLSCMMCFGFWTGMLLGLVYWSPTNLMIYNNSYRALTLLLDGFLASGSIWLIYCWTLPKLNGMKV